ncbi:MAG TPA: hypothetical protein VN113_08290, partial [Caulobacter sp.]|nr:hypothetical protein [Caulobacter sp.]
MAIATERHLIMKNPDSRRGGKDRRKEARYQVKPRSPDAFGGKIVAWRRFDRRAYRRSPMRRLLACFAVIALTACSAPVSGSPTPPAQSP